MKDYRNADGINFSLLKIMVQKSPYHMKYAMENPAEPTKAMLFGTAVHKAVLEPDEFKNSYVVEPKIDKRTKQGKIEFKEFTEENEGKTIISQQDDEKIKRIVENVFSNDDAREFVENFDIEKAFFKTIPTFDGDILCKCKVDGIKQNVIFDLKTTQDISIKGFRWNIKNYLYHLQAAMYCEITESKDFYFIVVETCEPYECAVYRLSRESIDIGKDIFYECLNEYASCLKNDNFYKIKSQEISIL